MNSVLKMPCVNGYLNHRTKLKIDGDIFSSCIEKFRKANDRREHFSVGELGYLRARFHHFVCMIN